jgi:poly(3-hydroxybutyrate) depolymerase
VTQFLISAAASSQWLTMSKTLALCGAVMIAAGAIAACSSGSGGGPGTGGAVPGTGGSSAAGKGGTSGGTAGSSGGASGTAGATGAAGTSGNAGTTGRGGTTGAGGTTGGGGAGTAGSTGAAGTTGAAGSMGAAGATGAAGTGGRGGTGTAGTGGQAGGGGTGTGGGAGSGAVKSAGCGKTPTLWGPSQGTAVLSSWPPAGRYTENTIQSGGTSRRYYLQVPSNYDNTHPYRLIIAYHWYTGAGIEVVDCHSEGINCYTTQSPFYGLWMLADSSTIFVAPDGTPAPTVQPAATANNNGSPKVTSSSAGWSNSNGQDIKLTNDILKAVEADLCIDTSRVFANGFSYGGAMSYEITCDPSTVSLFRGVAIYSGSPVLSGCSAPGGKPMTPIAAYLSHGNQDPTNMFSWGQQMRDALAADNGCKAPTSSLATTVDNAGAGTHTCYSYDGCSAGHPVQWCVFGKQEGCTGGDHSPTPCDKSATKPWNPQQVWNFITQF